MSYEEDRIQREIKFQQWEMRKQEIPIREYLVHGLDYFAIGKALVEQLYSTHDFEVNSQGVINLYQGPKNLPHVHRDILDNITVFRLLQKITFYMLIKEAPARIIFGPEDINPIRKACETLIIAGCYANVNSVAVTVGDNKFRTFDKMNERVILSSLIHAIQ